MQPYSEQASQCSVIIRMYKSATQPKLHNCSAAGYIKTLQILLIPAKKRLYGF